MMGNEIVLALIWMCECCYTGCDCGCVIDCPINHQNGDRA